MAQSTALHENLYVQKI